MIRIKRLLDQAGDANGGGNGGEPNSGYLTGGGTPPASGGGSGVPDDKVGGAQGGGGDGAAPTEVKFPDNWKMGLPSELREDSSLKSIVDVQGLAKSYINAQKLVGADKIPVPSKHATDEDWRGVYSKLGLPEDPKGYEFKADGIKPETTEAFRAAAHKAGLLPKQAQGVIEWLGEHSKQVVEQAKQAHISKQSDEIKALKTEWGAAFDQKVSAAANIFKEFATQDDIKYIQESGLSNDTRLLKIFAKVADSLKDHKIVGNQNSGEGMLTPDAAQEKIGSIFGNKEHPYNIPSHPNHKSAVDEVQKLFSQAYPS